MNREEAEGFETALQAPISRECWVQIRFQGKPTRQAIEKLARYMKLLEETYASEAAASETEADAKSPDALRDASASEDGGAA